MKTARLPGLRLWLAIGVVGWALLMLLHHGGIALLRMTYGLSFVGSWTGLATSLVHLLVGAALTPLVGVAFTYGPGARERRSSAALLYAAIGVAYWLTWAFLFFALGATGAIHSTRLTTTIVFTAFLSLAAYAVMVLLHEAVRSLYQARQGELEATRLQAELSRAQAAALRARLNPEFLFETFATASDLMAGNARAARRVLSDTGVLLRASLGRNGTDRVSCDEELELLGRYLDVQRARLGPRLRVDIQIEPAASYCALPPLVLQPVVEDVVRLGGAGEAGVVTVHVRAWREGDELRIRVVGRAEGLGGDGARALGGPGLDRTRARLVAACGEAASVEAAPHEAGGVQIEVRVPQSDMDGFDER